MYTHKWAKFNRDIPENGLILYFHAGMFDGSNHSPQTGTTKINIYDLSNLGHVGSLQNFDTLAHNVHKGNNTIIEPYAIKCDGINDRIAFPSHSSWALSNKLTFAFWVKPVGWGTSDFPRLLERWSYSLYFSKNNSALNFTLDTATSSSDPGIFSTDIWQFFVATWDNALPEKHAKLYKDGLVIKELDTHTNSLNTVTSSDLYIANRYDGNRAFEGELGPCYIYNRALTSPEVTQLYKQKPILRKKFIF